MRQWTVDAFASEPFKGNPACVLEPLRAWPADDRLRALAAENNQAETAFLLATDDAARFGLRWFTPTVEVPLCGHATLGSAHVLFTELGAASEAITFDTLSGPLVVQRAEGAGYRMDFPSVPSRRIDPPPGLTEALGVQPVEVWQAMYLVAVLENEDAVRGARPNLSALEAIASAAVGGRGNVGVSALAAPGAPYDVVSRFFAPGSGVAEDPATGSLHCILSPLWTAKLGRPRLRFHQAYPGRGGDLTCEAQSERVLIEGAAVTVMEARLRVGL